MRLLVTRHLPDVVLQDLAPHFDITVREDQSALTADQSRQAMMEFDAILPTLGDDFSISAFEGLSDQPCKILANFGVGFNHIDANTAATNGIAVTNTPGAVTDATADIAVMLMLMTCRRAGEGERLVRAGKWFGWKPTQMLGMHMTGKRLAILGMGRIGQAIAHRCHAGFGMQVSFYNRSEKQVAGCVQMPTIMDAVKHADIVVAAVPGSPETHHMVDRAVFDAMPDHAVFVNISRGDVVDEAALISALQSGQIGGAGLDVYEHEPVVPEALMKMENVTLLPHLGTAALEVRVAMGQLAAQNLRAFATGQDLPNQV